MIKVTVFMLHLLGRKLVIRPSHQMVSNKLWTHLKGTTYIGMPGHGRHCRMVAA